MAGILILIFDLKVENTVSDLVTKQDFVVSLTFLT